MVRMIVFYALAMMTFVAGMGGAGILLLGVQSNGVAALELTGLVGSGVSLLLSAASLRQGRKIRRRIEAAHRERYVIDLARRRGGLLKAADVGQAVGMPDEDAQKLLEGMVRKGTADIDVDAVGETVFSFDGRRLLGPGP